jgi:hypothetical protein
MCPRAATARIDGVNSGLAIAITFAVPALAAALWVAASIVADGLPEAAGPAELSRRSRLLVALVALALTATAAATATAMATDHLAALQIAPTAAAAAVAVLALRRLVAVRRGAAAFAEVPDSPLPPGLRAAAAHPMIGLPIQACGLAALPAAVAGVVPLDGAVGPAVTAAVPLVVGIGVRHALRHNRLAERAITVPTRAVRAAGYRRA